MAQIKEQSITSELSDEEIANLSDGEFKALVIKMLMDLIELGQKKKWKKQTKDTQSEIKQKIQGTNSDMKETRTQVNNLGQRKEINIHPEEKEETRIKKMKRDLGTSGTIWNVPIS